MEDVLYTKEKANKNFFSKFSSSGSKQSKTKGQPRSNLKGCYRCGKPRHIKRDCHVKIMCNWCGKSRPY